MDSLWITLPSEFRTPLLIISLLTLLTLIASYIYSNLRSSLHLQGKKIPAGSFGFPVIGETISFLRASKQDKVDEWLEKRVRKYGPLFKTSLFGSKVVVLSCQAGSRFLFQGGDHGISFHQPKSVANIIGKNNLFELSGTRHKLIRGAVVGFLQPESIQQVVGQVDSGVEKELLKELDGKDSVKIVDLMKKLAFNIAWSTFFGHDTIAVLVTLFIRHLSRDNKVYNKVIEEQMEVMKAKRENENGRVTFFRQTTRDINFEGFHVPKGWQVGLFPSSTHMEEKIFEGPNKFDPSRFEKKSYPPYTYLPFGAGPRICPGAEFGKIESMLVIHHFITKYEWKEMIPDEPITINPMTYPAMGLPVKFRLKKS
ncbi:Cytochrome P450 716B1 [Euphorbia peplus]|nr:Cytochrome P450 716B1 [Euphorbia peplus]